MDHQSLILGELRGFKEEALRRLVTLEESVESLKRIEWMRRGKIFAISAAGGVLGTIAALVATYLWH